MGSAWDNAQGPFIAGWPVRLHRFAELTGHDITHPEHAAVITVAFADRQHTR